LPLFRETKNLKRETVAFRERVTVPSGLLLGPFGCPLTADGYPAYCLPLFRETKNVKRETVAGR
jgi:hypothetical protein